MHKILVVDDEAYISTQLEERLTSMGYEVVGSASSGEDSVDMAKSLMPDLILMDIVMPGRLDGIGASEIIKEQLDIPIIFLTAYADDTLIKRAKKVEPCGYILKPFQEKGLKASIEVGLYKKEKEEHLRDREKGYHSLFEYATDIIHILDGHGRIMEANPAMHQRAGFTENKLVGRRLDEFFTPASKKIFKEQFPVLLKKDAIHQEIEFVYKDGKLVTMDWSASAVRDEKGEITSFISSMRDITDYKQEEEKSRRSCDQLRELLRYQQSSREEEMQVTAHEIREELGQALAALKMELSWLEKRLITENKVLLEKTKTTSKLIDTTIKSVRKISEELRPGLLDDLGLVAAIEWQTEEFQSRTGITCRLAADPKDIEVDEKRSTALFRIFQETLTNVARHAQATRVYVSLKEKDEHLELRIRDNGIGIKKEQVSNPKSFGLLGTGQRVHPWGGEVNISGRPGKGTTVVVRVPVGGEGET